MELKGRLRLSDPMIYAILGLIVALLPLFLGDYLVFVFSIICVYIIVAFGMNLLAGYTGMLSLGHQAFFGMGAYTVAILTTRIHGFPFPLTLFLGGFLSALIGYFLGFSALRTSGVYLAIATIAFAMIMGEIFNEWSALTGGPSGLSVLPPSLGSIQFKSSRELFYLILVVTAIMFSFGMNLISSNIGRSFIAVRESELSAQSYGISLVKTKTLSFAISAFYVGVAGGLYAYLIKYIAPIDFTLLVGIDFVVIVIIGGLGTIAGSIIGAIILFALPQLFAGLIDWQEMVTGAVLLVVILFLPEGLSGGLRRATARIREFLSGIKRRNS